MKCYSYSRSSSIKIKNESWPIIDYRSIYLQILSRRNVGNIFVFVLDIVASLLDLTSARSFQPYLSKLEKLAWTETHEGVKKSFAEK